MFSANKDIVEILSHNILFLRNSNNITKKEMAKILGVGIETLNKLEKGVLPPRLNVEVLIRIQEYFNVPLCFQVSEKIGDTSF